MAMSARRIHLSALVDFLDWCVKEGFTVSENVGYGKRTVHPTAHNPRSFHYDEDTWQKKRYSLAADINKNGPDERSELLRAMKEAQYRGLAVIFAAYGTKGAAFGHQGHLHVDVGEWSNTGRGDIKARRVARPKPPAVKKKVDRGDTSGTVLRAGDSGKRVIVLQKHLKTNYPLYAGKLALDGKFGPMTERAVAEYQRRAGLSPDGQAGPKTFRSLGLKY